MAANIIYTGHFVREPDELLAKVPPQITGEGSRVYAHHVTKQFRPENGAEDVTPGRLRTVRAIGQVAAEGVHALLVEPTDGEPLSTNKYPHITIATANGVAPVKSGEVIAAAVEAGTISPLEPPLDIQTVEGYFSDGRVTTGPPAESSPPAPAS